MPKNINDDKFPEETKLKLEIFSQCFREWLPVFIYNRYIKGICICDFFAGSGTDTEGNFGSPLILLDEARKYCNIVKIKRKYVYFAFNEKIKEKQEELERNVNKFIDKCKKKECANENCIYHISFGQEEFKNISKDVTFNNILSDATHAKFILLDQYGFSQVDENVFLKLVDSPTTDFIFFISSSFIRRFKDHPVIKHYFDTKQIKFDETKPKECHRLIADYYQNLVPRDKEYYLHHFTIKKGANYWGLIFGTNHTLGMEKFLKVCWNKDPYSGESNFNIDNDYPEGSLFHNVAETNKKQKVKQDICEKILSGQILDNITGLKYALKNRCLPELFTIIVKDLEKENRIKRFGDLNYSSVNIHRVNFYQIEVIKS